MDNNVAQQILSEILAQAEKGESTKFRFITSWNDYLACRKLYKSNKLIIRILKSSSVRLFKTYRKDVIAGISDVTKLLAYCQLDDVIAFYNKELDTLDNMLDEYENYLCHGNFIYALLGGERDSDGFNF